MTADRSADPPRGRARHCAAARRADRGWLDLPASELPGFPNPPSAYESFGLLALDTAPEPEPPLVPDTP